MSTQLSDTVVLKFEDMHSVDVNQLRRYQGLVRASSLIDLIDVIDLEANPRSSKTGSVTSEILESIAETPEFFHLKTKGILLGASSCIELERKRLKIQFADTNVEGILDGGHNTLAIGIHILQTAGLDSSKIKRIKTWEDFRELWNSSATEINHVKSMIRRTGDENFDPKDLEFLVPIELIVPQDENDPNSLDAFSSSLVEICAARNNNVELRTEARANRSGYFDYLREVLPLEISKEVEWKTNEGGSIKAADVIALTWIPLSMLPTLPHDNDKKPVTAPPPQNIYRSKGDCLTRFEQLMSLDAVTESSGAKSKLANAQVKSAIDVASDLPELYDIIYAKLPAYYNAQKLKFGRITAVSKLNKSIPNPKAYSKFTKVKVDYVIPEGFVVPFVYGLQSLMEITEGGQVRWKTDPKAFLENHLEGIVQTMSQMFPVMQYDPQKFGKELINYTLSKNAYETALIQEQGHE